MTGAEVLRSVKSENIAKYTECIENSCLSLHSESTNCNTRAKIDELYEHIKSNINTISVKYLKHSSEYKPFLKPYWDQELKALHKSMKRLRTIWISEGRPRGNNFDAYRNYKLAKCRFRNSHRIKAEQYMKTLNDEIDTAAEVDNGYFWKLVNRRKSGQSSVGSQIKFGDSTCRSPDEICEKWGDFFATLYSKDDPDAFDNENYIAVKAKVDSLKSRELNDSEIPSVTDRELLDIISGLRSGKASGEDRIYNEHFKHGGPHLRRILLVLFNAMLKQSYIPEKMKVGVIITVFKGGNKRKDDPNSYRAITLTSALLKLYERVLHTRLVNSVPQALNPLQGGFQKHMGCNMTSFLLQESVHYAKENNSKLYVCFLDVKQAFDNVWHDGLFLKLEELGIDLYIWKAFVSLYENVTSYVNYRGFRSRLFQIFKGTRQGGVASPFLYLCFKNDLMNLLCASIYGFCMNGIKACCPTVADDMALLALSKFGLQQLMNICFRFSQLWRYLYNALKCAILVFNESLSHYARTRRHWYLGSDEVLERTSYVHLGIECNKEMKVKSNIVVASSKIRQNYFGILNSGISGKDLHPLTLKKIYDSVVLPRALYGCEFWHDISNSDLLSLERSHRFCVKSIQNIDRCTRSCVALSLLGSRSLEKDIQKRKLILFGQLCRLDPFYTVKRIFIYRLIAQVYFNDLTHGFVIDSLNIISKFNLMHMVRDFISLGHFPGKYSWKTITNGKLTEQRDLEFFSQIAENRLDRLLRFHPGIRPNYFWELSRKHLGLLPACKSVVKLIGLLFNSNPRSICPACLEDFDPLAGHIILRCESNAKIRHDMWMKIWTNFGDDVYISLASMDEETLLDVLLGSFDTVPYVQHLENKDSFYMIVAGSLHRLLREVHGDAL